MDRASRPLLTFVRRSVNPQVRASFFARPVLAGDLVGG